MPFTFEIRPIGIESGFSLSCDGLLTEAVRHSRLINAVVAAVRLARDLPGDIRIYDCTGSVAEIVPLPADAMPAPQAESAAGKKPLRARRVRSHQAAA